jgi:hypothetical protein
MAAASSMYGVTMQERGVSRIVSVKFNEHKPQTLQTPIPVEPSLAVPAAV